MVSESITSWLSSVLPTIITITMVSISVAGLLVLRYMNTRITVRNSKSLISDDAMIPGSNDVDAAVDQAIKRISKMAEKGHLSRLRETLPLGWEVGITTDGNIYYVDHNSRVTTWQHPTLNDYELLRLQIDTESSYVEDIHKSMPAIARDSVPSPLLSRSRAQSNFEDMNDLPEGWEVSLTKEGIPYFVNHISHETTWVDPRTQKPSVASTQTVFLLNQLKASSGTWNRRSSWSTASTEPDRSHRRSLSNSSAESFSRSKMNAELLEQQQKGSNKTKLTKMESDSELIESMATARSPRITVTMA